MALENCTVGDGQAGDKSPTIESLGPATVDRTRRRVLGWLSALTGLAGVGIASIPFLESLQPSAKARSEGAPVRVDLRGIPSGEELTVIWRGHPVRILHRTPKMLEELANDHWRHELRDPDSNETTQQPTYAQNETRSIRPDYLIVIATCTHLGCVPLFEPETPNPSFGVDWPGGYFCPCHGSRFDLAGRVVKHVPAPTNLVVPPHRYLTSDLLEIGTDAVA